MDMGFIQEVLATATMYAIFVVAAVEAIRKRIPFDGWKVLVVSAVCSVGVVALFLQDYTTAGILHGGRVAFATALISVGGDAWVQKIAKLLSPKTVALPGVQVESYGDRESPTKKDVRGGR